MKYITGFILGQLVASLFWYEPWVSRDRKNMLLRYEAYRMCIPNPNCMTADDYIEYYDLHWKMNQQR